MKQYLTSFNPSSTPARGRRTGPAYAPLRCSGPRCASTCNRASRRSPPRNWRSSPPSASWCFLRATRSAAEFRELGCKVWDQNANENAQWLANPYREGPDDWVRCTASNGASGQPTRCSTPVVRRRSPTPWRAAMPRSRTGRRRRPKVLLYKAVDQLRQCPDTIHERPGDRRILFHGWNWAQIEEMALPPCHLLYRSCRTPARARSRCACTSAPTTSAWARPST